MKQHDSREKILTHRQAIKKVRSAQAKGDSVVFTNGCFDIIHAGHVGYLEEARAQGDRLIVGVNDDASVRRLKGPARPLNDLGHRMQVLRGLAAVDWVVPFSEDTPERLICRLGPDVLVKGGDYRPDEVAGGDHLVVPRRVVGVARRESCVLV